MKAIKRGKLLQKITKSVTVTTELAYCQNSCLEREHSVVPATSALSYLKCIKHHLEGLLDISSHDVSTTDTKILSPYIGIV